MKKFLLLIALIFLALPQFIEANPQNDEQLRELIKDLKSRDPAVEMNAVVLLGNPEYENNKEALSALLDVLGEADKEFNIKIVDSIGRISRGPSVLDESNAQKLKKILLVNKDEEASYNLIKTVGRVGNKSFIPVLIEMLKGRQFNSLPKPIGETIATIGNKDIVPELISLLKGYNGVVTKEELSYIVRDIDVLWDMLIKKGFINNEGVILDKFIYPRLFFDDLDIRSLISRDKQNEVEVFLNRKIMYEISINIKAAAAYALKGLGEKSAIPALIEILNEKKHEYYTVRRQTKEAAIEALLVLDKRSLFPKLLSLLDNNDDYLREKAAAILGDFGDEDHSVLLPALICKINSKMSLTVIRSLAKVGDVSVVPNFIDLVDNHENDPDKAVCAAWALGEMGDARAIEVLQKIHFQHVSDELEKTSLESLKKLQDKLGRKDLTKYFEEETADKESVYDKLRNLVDDPFLNTDVLENDPKYFSKRLENEQIVFKNVVTQLEDKDPLKRKEAAELLGTILCRHCSVRMFQNPVDENLIKSHLIKFVNNESVPKIKLGVLTILMYSFDDLDYIDMFREYLTCLPDYSYSCEGNVRQEITRMEITDKILSHIDQKNDKRKGYEIFLFLNDRLKQEQSRDARINLTGLTIHVLEYIGRYRTEDTLAVIADVFDSDKPKHNYLQRNFLKVIGTLKMKEGIAILHKALENKNLAVGSEAAIAIRLLGDKKSIPYLLDFVRNHGLLDSEEALISLGDFRAEAVLPVIIGRIQFDKFSYVYYGEEKADLIAGVMYKINKNEALKQLKSVVYYENEYMIKNVSYMIEKLSKGDFSEFTRERLSLNRTWFF